MKPKPRICRIASVAQTFDTLLYEQIQYIISSGIDLTLVCSPDTALTRIAGETGAKSVGIRILRKPSPFRDIITLITLIRFFKSNRYDIVHSSTPKAGLLAALACKAAKIPLQIHTFTGQPWVELKGAKRRFYIECDRIVGRMSTKCYADSHTQRNFLIQNNVVQSERIVVIGAGSISGVNIDRFSRRSWDDRRVLSTRAELGIPKDALVIVFVGRITRDKGISELSAAFNILSKKYDNAYLLIVGPNEVENDRLLEAEVKKLQNNPRVRIIGFTSKPEKYLAASDVFCLPSYREGFGSVVIEAAAMELPAIVTRVTGLIDSVVEDETGIVVPPKDSIKLADGLEKLLSSEKLREVLGMAAKERVEKIFSSKQINEGVVKEYYRLIENFRRV